MLWSDAMRQTICVLNAEGQRGREAEAQLSPEEALAKTLPELYFQSYGIAGRYSLGRVSGTPRALVS